MTKKELDKRNKAVLIFSMSEKYSKDYIVDFLKNSPKYYIVTQDDWETIMNLVEKIGKIHSDNPYPDDCENNEFIIQTFEITRYGFYLNVYVAKGGKWIVSEWYSLNRYISGDKKNSTATSYKEAIWKTVSDFASLWCELNGYKI